MGGLLGHHGFADFLGNAAAIREQHSESGRSLQGLLARWYATFGSSGSASGWSATERSFE